MKITNINLRKFEDKGRLKAVGSITFDSEFVVRDVSVVEGKDGLFIITGCSHAGICNIIEQAKRVCGKKKIKVKVTVN